MYEAKSIYTVLLLEGDSDHEPYFLLAFGSVQSFMLGT
jgi:hypothetical protein